MRSAFIRGLTLALLQLTAVGAVLGGWQLMTDPTGGKLGMSTGLLAHSPFTDFFWPGVILFTLIGLGSIAATIRVMRQLHYYSIAVMLVGVSLTGWIGIQILLIREFHWLQAAFGSIGLVLMAAGAWLRRARDPLV
jgi:hypothetical protein